MIRFILIAIFVCYGSIANPQTNPIRTAVPFLLIPPDTRAGGMGDVGAATTPDIQSMHWNPAKYAFISGKSGISLNYTPWLKKLIDDIRLVQLAGYRQISEFETLAGSVKYYSLGKVEFTDQEGNPMLNYTPNEFSLDAAYIRKIADRLSLSVTFRYIHSGVGAGDFLKGEAQPGNAIAADVGVYYIKPILSGNRDSQIAFGLLLSNLGTSMEYGAQSYFLPTNLRIGTAYTLHYDDKNELTLALDLNKLLIPLSSSGSSLQRAIFSSFSDAPGGFSEEMQEINISFGLEWLIGNVFALRGGYFYSHPKKEDRRYFTMGAGIHYRKIVFDLSYLISTQLRNPLNNTIRVGIGYNF